MDDRENLVEQGAETIRLPDGTGYALTICDYPDRCERVVTLLHVLADDTDSVVYEHVVPT